MAKKRNRITAAMSQTIAETSPLIKKQKNNLQEVDENNVLEVDLQHLVPNPYQPRIDINVKSLNELISSIEQNGLMQPIVITEKNNDGKYTIVAGHRRYEAFKIMGENTIKAILLKNISEKDLAILSLTENLMRENLHPIENAIAIQNILTSKLVESQNKLAEYVGLSKGYVSKLMNVLKLPHNVIQIIKKDNYKDINILILLNKLKNENEMLIVYEKIKHLPRLEAEKFIKQNYLNNKKSSASNLQIKTSASKINLNIDIKSLSEEQKKIIDKEVQVLTEKLNTLFQKWGS